MRDDKLMYAGKVGTGWGRAIAADIRRRMDALVRKTSPLEERIRKPDTFWVEPRYVGEGMPRVGLLLAKRGVGVRLGGLFKPSLF
jgi:ATP dependent DNA ligase C terminal region